MGSGSHLVDKQPIIFFLALARRSYHCSQIRGPPRQYLSLQYLWPYDGGGGDVGIEMVELLALVCQATQTLD